MLAVSVRGTSPLAVAGSGSPTKPLSATTSSTRMSAMIRSVGEE